MLKWSALLAFACLMLVTGAIALNAAAEKPEKEAKPATQTAATQTAPNTTPVNKKCPISGDDIDPKGKTVTYKGKTIAFCCDDCIEKFNKNPEKYVANLK